MWTIQNIFEFRYANSTSLRPKRLAWNKKKGLWENKNPLCTLYDLIRLWSCVWATVLPRNEFWETAKGRFKGESPHQIVK